MTRTDRVDATDLTAFALDLVAEAGQVTQQWFRSSELTVETKSDGSPVTIADTAAETLMRNAISEAFPNDRILGEEFGDSAANPGSAQSSGREWVIDPIDGTKSFTAGVPLWANLLAVIDDGVPVLGIINLPAVTETVIGVAGKGAFCNGERCQVSDRDRLDGAYAMTSGVRYWPHGGLDRLADAGVIVRTWGDAYGYALVATGRVEAMIDPLANKWDVAPIGVILNEAGGRFTDLGGIDRIDGGNGLGTNGHLHDQLLAVVPDKGRE